MIEKKPRANKHQIITEYLSSDHSFASLAEKHGVNLRTIQTWVRAFRANNPETASVPIAAKGNEKELRKQLEQAQIKNELLEEIINLAEEQTGIDLRKKFGAKQS